MGWRRSRYDGALLAFFSPTDGKVSHRPMAERAYGTPADRRRKLMMVSREIGLTRDERLELASYILRRDVTTWKTLSDEQVWRMLDALEGFELISTMLEDRYLAP